MLLLGLCLSGLIGWLGDELERVKRDDEVD